MCVKNQTGGKLKCDANHIKLNLKNMYADFNSNNIIHHLIIYTIKIFNRYFDIISL